MIQAIREIRVNLVSKIKLMIIDTGFNLGDLNLKVNLFQIITLGGKVHKEPL